MAIYQDIPKEGVKWWDGKFHNPSTSLNKISICTTCMGRAEDVKVTLTKNMLDNEDYPNAEFVLLNYNSKDDLDKWVRTDSLMQQAMTDGRLLYLHTTEPRYFNFSHSKNVAFRAASGSVVTNVDADNFINKGFVSFLNKCANECPEMMLSRRVTRLYGRVGFHKKDFIDILGGYDENMSGYGYEERDLVNRANHLGFITMHYDARFCDRRMLDHGTNRKPDASNLEFTAARTEHNNIKLSCWNMKKGIFKANVGKPWGRAKLTVNFEKEIEL